MKILKFLLVAVTLFAAQFAFADWAAPKSAPPVCTPGDPGCDAPINVGTSTQLKSGGLGVAVTGGGFSVGPPAALRFIVDSVTGNIFGRGDATFGYVAGSSGGVFLTKTSTYGKPAVQAVTPGFDGESLLLNPNGGTVVIANQLQIKGGSPGDKKVLTSDASGLASWQTPVAGGGGVQRIDQGVGIVLTPNPITNTGTVAADFNTVQKRVTGQCDVGNAIRVIDANGQVTCQAAGGGASFWKEQPLGSGHIINTNLYSVGIGYLDTKYKLSVGGKAIIAGDLNVAENLNATGDLTARAGTLNGKLRVTNNEGESSFRHSDGGYLYIQPKLAKEGVRLGGWYSAGGQQDSIPLILQDAGGNVGIGTASPDSNFKLDVNGSILTRGMIWLTGTGYPVNQIYNISPVNVSTYSPSSGDAGVASGTFYIPKVKTRLSGAPALSIEGRVFWWFSSGGGKEYTVQGFAREWGGDYVVVSKTSGNDAELRLRVGGAAECIGKGSTGLSCQ